MQKKIKYQNRYCRMLSIMRPIAADCRVKIQKHIAKKTLKLPENTINLSLACALDATTTGHHSPMPGNSKKAQVQAKRVGPSCYFALELFKDITLSCYSFISSPPKQQASLVPPIPHPISSSPKQQASLVPPNTRSHHLLGDPPL
jgi:hypothetical protein